MKQQARELAQLHQPVDKMASILKSFVAWEETQ
jgi:hypothetical protein